MKNANDVSYNKTVVPFGSKKPIKCDGSQCGHSNIEEGKKYWKSGTRIKHILCQKCFGFWLSRYSMFDYNPFAVDAEDLKWKDFYNQELTDKLLELELNKLINI